MSVAIPMVNQPNLYVDQMYLSWVDATHINISVGECRNSSNINDIQLPGTINLNAAIQGAGGIDIGVLADNSLYGVYAIGDSLGYNLGSVVLSLSAIAPTLPLGYDMYRRIGTILTDAGANILQFRQTGDSVLRTFWYDAGIQVLNGGASAGFAAVALTNYMRAFQTNVTFNAILTPTGNGDTATVQPTNATDANGYIVIGGSQAGVALHAPITVPCNAAGSIDYKVTGTLTLYLRAYEDILN